MQLVALNDSFLHVNGILESLHKIAIDVANIPQGKQDLAKARKLEAIKARITAMFFEKLDEQGIQVALRSETSRFNPDYTALKEVLLIVYSQENTLEEMIAQIESLTDRAVGAPVEWIPNEVDVKRRLEQLNQHSNYFDLSLENPQLMALFTDLVIACRKIAVLIEQNNTPDDNLAYTYAYRLMALCINSTTGQVPNLSLIAKQAEKLFRASNAVANKAPYHDFLLNMVQLPDASRINDMLGWRQFLVNNMKDNAVSALRFFANASAIEEQIAKERADHLAPKTLLEAQNMSARCHFKRGAENPEMAMLCKKHNVPEDAGIDECSFNKCLDFLATISWPVKEGDNLPSPIIEGVGVAEGYYWVKLPTNDLRALILGQLTSSCQNIGGHSDLCVRDAVSLPNNGLYVLLKQISGLTQKKAPFNEDHSINYDDFEILGQSYAWISKTGNLTLDSLECSHGSDGVTCVPISVAETILTAFATQVLLDNSSIKRVTLGTGGGTPHEFRFEEAQVIERMRQGEFYGDASRQMIILKTANLFNETELSSLIEDEDVRDKMLYLGEHLQKTDNAMQELRMVLQENPMLSVKFKSSQLLKLLRYSSSPTLNDLKPVDWRSLPADITVGRLMWQVKTLKQLIVALDYFPIEERFDALKIKLKTSAFDELCKHPEHAKNILKCFSVSDYSAVLSEPDSQGIPLLMHIAAHDINLLKEILSPLSEHEKLKVLSVKDKHDSSILFYAVTNPILLKELLDLFPQPVLQMLLRHKNKYGITVLHEGVVHTGSFKLLLEEYPELERFAALTQKTNHRDTVLMNAKNTYEIYKISLELLPMTDRLKMFKEPGQYGLKILPATMHSPALIKELLLMLPASERYAAVTEKGFQGKPILWSATNRETESLKVILSSLPESNMKMAFEQRAANDFSILYQAAKDPELFMMIKDFLPLRDLKTMLQRNIIPTFVIDGFNELKSIIIRRIQEQGYSEELTAQISAKTNPSELLAALDRASQAMIKRSLESGREEDARPEGGNTH